MALCISDAGRRSVRQYWALKIAPFASALYRGTPSRVYKHLDFANPPLSPSATAAAAFESAAVAAAPAHLAKAAA